MSKASGASLKLVIASEIKLVDLVHQASEKMAELAGLDAEEALNLGLAVREAVINAIVHGNKGDPRLKIWVTLSTERRALKARIRDQGNGFDPERTPDPTTGPNLLRTSGRGLLLMRAFVDQVSFKHIATGGTEVILTKRLPR